MHLDDNRVVEKREFSGERLDGEKFKMNPKQ